VQFSPFVAGKEREEGKRRAPRQPQQDGARKKKKNICRSWVVPRAGIGRCIFSLCLRSKKGGQERKETTKGQASVPNTRGGKGGSYLPTEIFRRGEERGGTRIHWVQRGGKKKAEANRRYAAVSRREKGRSSVKGVRHWSTEVKKEMRKKKQRVDCT